MQTKIVGVLMILAVAACVLPVLNLVERTSVQGKINDLLTQQNIHAYHDQQQIQEMVEREVLEIVGEDANMEVILYHYTGTVPKAQVPEDINVPSLPGIRNTAAYYEVSALVARVFWLQTKLWGQNVDTDGNPIGTCYLCPEDARAQRIVFVPEDKMGQAYLRPASDVDFVKDPVLLLEWL